jgi:DNA-directed RNA polymerase specialized sigma24 family protein
MASETRRPVDEQNREILRLEEVVRLMVVSLRRQMASQTELITEMDRAGFAERRIAQLVGTTQGTVHVTVQRARKQQSPKRVPSKGPQAKLAGKQTEPARAGAPDSLV